MPYAVSISERWKEASLTSAPQIINCVYCVLLRWEHDNLTAPYWRWYWNDRPGAYVFTPRQRIPLEPDRVLLIPPHTPFGTGNDGTVGHLYMHFALGLVRPVVSDWIYEHAPSEDELRLIRRLVAAIERQEFPGASGATFLAQAVLNSTLAAAPEDLWEGAIADGRIAQALQDLAAVGNDSSNSTLARAAGMNINAFIRKFTQATGYSPHQYRLRIRIERACGWLREGKLTLEEIAEATGFCDRFHFSRVFKQIMGEGPARFRRNAVGPERGW